MTGLKFLAVAKKLSPWNMKYKKTKIFSAAILFCFLAPVATHAAYDFYVDKNSFELTEDGSIFFPWKTIGAALFHIQNENLKNKTIFIKNGNYAESISIANSAKLIGESRSETTIDAAGKSNAVNFISTKSEIRNMTIKNADATNIIIDKKSKATISNCKIEKAGKYGIEVKESSANQKYEFTIKDSEVSESGSQGLYILKRRISVSGNEIFSNEEEGIDLHPGNKGTVSGNRIHGNSESGIESILSGASLNIKNNQIENNHTQGLTVQVYSASGKGKVKISGNTIRGNHAYGIRFANYTRSIGPKKFKIFADKYVKLSKNDISDNDSGKYVYE
jgi:parallel beta-helix repeat protein